MISERSAFSSIGLCNPVGTLPLWFLILIGIFIRIEKLLKHIERYHPISPAAEDALHENFACLQFKKNDVLVHEGKICRHLYFVEQGCMRGYYNLEGKEVTHWFAFEDDFVTSFHSFITQKPAVE